MIKGFQKICKCYIFYVIIWNHQAYNEVICGEHASEVFRVPEYVGEGCRRHVSPKNKESA